MKVNIASHHKVKMNYGMGYEEKHRVKETFDE
jgi:hypothetical protein